MNQPKCSSPLDRAKLVALLEANYDAYASDTEGLSALGWNAIRAVLPQVIQALQSETADIERAFQMLEACGVPRERAKTVANGIDVLATRLQRDEGFQRMLIRDAARYRWLREEAKYIEIVTNQQMFRVSGGENLDMTIDTAATP